MMKGKKDKEAVALGYEPERHGAPTVYASGKGEIAKKIIETAEKHGIPIRKDPALLEVLSLLNIGEEIPENVYKAVAEILAFVYSIERSM